MKWLKWGALGELSPMGVLVAGLAIGTVGMPVLKKGLRALVYATTKGVVAVAGQVKDAGEKLGQDWQQIVTEVEAEREKKREAVRTGLRGAGVGLIRTGIGISDQARSKIEGIKEEWKGLVEEARAEPNGAGEVTEEVMEEPSPVVGESHVGGIEQTYNEKKVESNQAEL